MAVLVVSVCNNMQLQHVVDRFGQADQRDRLLSSPRSSRLRPSISIGAGVCRLRLQRSMMLSRESAWRWRTTNLQCPLKRHSCLPTERPSPRRPPAEAAGHQHVCTAAPRELMNKANVRRLAVRWGWEEVQHNAESRVLGFVKGKHRVNVYYTTGERAVADSPAYQKGHRRGRSSIQSPCAGALPLLTGRTSSQTTAPRRPRHCGHVRQLPAAGKDAVFPPQPDFGDAWQQIPGPAG
jgi:hypothetical protein